ncbi:hypothetical protein EY01_15600 [Staphylococcus aureus]|nr:hypothetical protein EY01_15600 [Staphylococcus aureus]
MSGFKGEIGQPGNGFNKDLQAGSLKGQEALTASTGEEIEPVDFEKGRELLEEEQQGHVTEEDIIS